MTGTKLARIRRCAECEEKRICPAWNWARCTAVGAIGQDLDDAWMEGPEANCPVGHWRALKPVDLNAEREAALVETTNRSVVMFGPFMDHMTNHDVIHALSELVGAGQMDLALSERIAEARGINLAEPA